MRILILEPFMGGSHASWVQGIQRHSAHQIDVLTLPGRHWKWRMHGGAITLARRLASSDARYDLIIATDMLDVTTFTALCRNRLRDTPVAVYFHENQLSYPWSPQDRDVELGRDFHYGFINWTSVLAADAVWFNSLYNMNSFYDGVEKMLKAMPDLRQLEAIGEQRAKSSVLPLGIDLEDLFVPVRDKDLSVPVILWNHRWEYDKGPDAFFEALRQLKARNMDFRLIVCGESYGVYPEVFDAVKIEFGEELLHIGFAESRASYSALLRAANLLPVTAAQEFFGQSAMEAVAAGCLPILPDALVYPEHVPDSLKQAILYKTAGELGEKLADFCRNMSASAPLTEVLQQMALQYDWKSVIALYDRKMEAMCC